MLARGGDADVNVIVLVGERGREVNEFIHDNLGDAGLARSVVVVATSDRPALERSRAAWVGTAIAEHFRDKGKRVRSEEHTSELQSLMRTSYAVFCLKKKKKST